MKPNEITVFICEDDEIARQIIDKYFNHYQITYAEIMDAKLRPTVVAALETVTSEVKN